MLNGNPKDEQQLIHRKQGTEKVRKILQEEGKVQAKRVYIQIQEHKNTLNFHNILYKSNSYQKKWKEYKFSNQTRLLLLAELLSVPQTEIYLKEHFKSSKYSQIHSHLVAAITLQRWWEGMSITPQHSVFRNAPVILLYVPYIPTKLHLFVPQISFKHLLYCSHCFRHWFYPSVLSSRCFSYISFFNDSEKRLCNLTKGILKLKHFLWIYFKRIFYFSIYSDSQEYQYLFSSNYSIYEYDPPILFSNSGFPPKLQAQVNKWLLRILTLSEYPNLKNQQLPPHTHPLPLPSSVVNQHPSQCSDSKPETLGSFPSLYP